MARTLITITQSWQLVAQGPVLITPFDKGEGILLINDTNSDIAAMPIKDLEQIEQRDFVDVYIRATGDGWEVILDQ